MTTAGAKINRHERRRAKRLEPKSFSASIREIGEMCDALFGGVHDEGQHGFVAISASEKGRRAVEAVFPSGRIVWRTHDDNVLGWQEFSINVVDCAAAMPDHKLPLEITCGVRLDDCSPDALAFLLAMAVKEQGLNVATFDRDDKCSIFMSSAGMQ